MVFHTPFSLPHTHMQKESLDVPSCVPVPIRVITKPKTVQLVQKGDMVNLTVVAVSDRLFTLSYKWIFNSKVYELDRTPPHVFYDVSSKLAYINTTGLTDEEMQSIKGVYRREVFHRIQKLIVNVEVRIRTAPGNGKNGTAGGDDGQGDDDEDGKQRN